MGLRISRRPSTSDPENQRVRLVSGNDGHGSVAADKRMQVRILSSRKRVTTGLVECYRPILNRQEGAVKCILELRSNAHRRAHGWTTDRGFVSMQKLLKGR